MLALFDLRAYRAYSCSPCSILEHDEHVNHVTCLLVRQAPRAICVLRRDRVLPISAHLLLLVTLGPLPKLSSQKYWEMSFAKFNNRISSQRKQFFLSNFEFLFVNMRLCKFYSFANKQCLLGDAFEKCLACVASRRFCDFVILPFIMRRVHKKRLRVRNEMREAKAKLQRLKKQLKRLKDEEENLILRE